MRNHICADAHLGLNTSRACLRACVREGTYIRHTQKIRRVYLHK